MSPDRAFDLVVSTISASWSIDRYLSLRLPGYDYEQHFGGVYYLFVRGISRRHPPGTGIFYDRPEPALIAQLSRLLAELGGRG